MFDWLRVSYRQTRNNINRRLKRLFRRIVRKLVETVIFDLELYDAVEGATSSLAFARKNLWTTPSFKHRDDLHRWMLGQVTVSDGLYLEFGVFRGESINRAAGLKPEVTFYGFDSFKGMTEAWMLGTKKGDFDLGGTLPPVRSNVKLIDGYFEDTLPGFVAAQAGRKIAFMHIDCDLYSATKTVFNETAGMLVPGTLIVFDEFFNYAGWEQGEYKAFAEFVEQTGVEFEYIGYVANARQVAVRLKGR